MLTNERPRNLHREAFVVAGILLATQIQPAYAYVDPGSISIVITAILGGIAAIGYTARMYLARIKDFFAGKRSPK